MHSFVFPLHPLFMLAYKIICRLTSMHHKATIRWHWTWVAWARDKRGSMARALGDTGLLGQKANATPAAIKEHIANQSAYLVVENQLKDGM